MKINPPDLSGQLLVSRQDAAQLLGNVSVATLMRLEKLGVLHPVSLNPNAPMSQKFYRSDDILAVSRQVIDVSTRETPRNNLPHTKPIIRRAVVKR